MYTFLAIFAITRVVVDINQRFKNIPRISTMKNLIIIVSLLISSLAVAQIDHSELITAGQINAPAMPCPDNDPEIIQSIDSGVSCNKKWRPESGKIVTRIWIRLY